MTGLGRIFSASHHGRHRYAPAALVLLCLSAPLVTADEIRRIVHPDGRIEYTNVPAERQNLRQGGKSETIYKYRRPNGTLTFTDQKPTHIRDYEVLRFDCYACRVGSTVDWHRTPLNLTAYADPIRRAANSYQVDPALVRAVIHAESAFRADARSNKGALGLMQLMPQTAADLGVSNALDEEQNIDGGVRYLAALLQRFNGDVRLATAAYNAGPGAVDRYAGIPPYQETRAYVERVGILHQRYANGR
jgi:hypothetical protein